MQPITNRSDLSDDEEDLESLRLAALRSLRRQAQPPTNGSAPVMVAAPKLCSSKGFGGSKSLHKRGRGFHGNGRLARNGGYNNRIRSSNLISVPTIGADETDDAATDSSRGKKFKDEVVPKLILPQDRYCNTKPVTEDKTTEVSSKFDRYNDSDKSESDSESEDDKTSEAESPTKLKRTSSLEALMQELENELQGSLNSVSEVSPKPKKVKKSRKSKVEVTSNDIAVGSSNLQVANETGTNKPEPVVLGAVDSTTDVAGNNKEQNCSLSSISAKIEMRKSPVRRKSKSPPQLKHNRRLPVRPMTDSCISQNRLLNSMHNLPFVNPIAVPIMPFQPAPYTNFNVIPYETTVPPYNYPPAPSLGCPTDVRLSPKQMFSPGRFERPISPLGLNTGILNTITAPLSPRSAAFVLHNREIIERRKKSPRRSYSRSPSPEFRRSLSPRYRRSNSRASRSPTPLRLIRRLSPGRKTSPNIRKLSPGSRRVSPNNQQSSRRCSPVTPKRKLSPPKRSSPVGQASFKKTPPKSSVHNRLGVQAANSSSTKSETPDGRRDKERKRSRSMSISLSPSPERHPSRKSSPIMKETESINPILEARKRKFETNGSVPTEGIIRLKPKSSDENIDFQKETTNDERKNDEEFREESKAGDLNEDELLGVDDTYIDFNVKVDDLFSDDESDNENEGRFKSDCNQSPRDVTVMPFTQLVNGPSSNVKTDTLSKNSKRLHDKDRDKDRDRREKSRSSRTAADRNPRRSPDRNRRKEDRERSRNKPVDRHRSRSPLRLQNQESTTTENKQSSKPETATKSENKKQSSIPGKRIRSRMMLKVDSKPDKKRPPIVSPIENKRIEIKIRNPSKYEVETQNYHVANKGEESAKEKKSNSRKVEVSNEMPNEAEDGENFNELESEVIYENEEEEDEDASKSEGDLRAQLSRKRAERQNKLPKAEGVSSRLLQNALQGAVFKKSKKSKPKKKDKEAAPADAKLPIHLRLGIPGGLDIFAEAKSHKRKRSKNRGTFDQV